MYSRYHEPYRYDYETDEEYEEACDAWNDAMMSREDDLVYERLERQYN